MLIDACLTDGPTETAPCRLRKGQRVSASTSHCAIANAPLQAYELSVLTGTQVLLLVVSETGLVYTFTTPKLQPLVTKPEGKNLIQVRCTAHAPCHAAPLTPHRRPA